MGSKTRRSLIQRTAQVRAAGGSIPQVSDPGAASVSTKMLDLYRQFLMRPTADRYRAVLSALVTDSSQACPSLSTLEQAHREGRFETVHALTRQWGKFFALSPRFHALAAMAAIELGDKDDAQLERFAADACLEGILKSGDGSDARPFVLSDRADAQEVLAKLGFRAIRQSLVDCDGTLCDVFEVRASAKSTREVWFSVARQPKLQPARAAQSAPSARSRKVKV
jgi:hypothetical protein